MLRETRKADTELGHKVADIMDSGGLVSDEIVSAMIDAKLADMGPETGAIFDGYPRTAAQADQLDDILARHGRKLDHVIELEVNEEALVERITGRFTCANCGAGYHDVFKQPAPQLAQVKRPVIRSTRACLLYTSPSPRDRG